MKNSIRKIITAFTLSLICILFGCTTPDNNSSNNPSENANLISISIDSKNAQTTFDLNETFNATGLQINGLYDNGTTSVIFAEDCNIVAPDMSTRGEKDVTISYQEKSSSYKIFIRELETISLDINAVQTQFDISEEFNYEGLVVYANYYDSTTPIQIKEGYEIVTPNLSTYGEKDVLVKYNGKETTYQITVAQKPKITAVNLEVTNNSLYYTVSGTAVGYKSTDFDLDVQETNTETWKVYDLTPEVSYENGSFTLKAEISLDILNPLNKVILISHLKVNNTSYDITGINNFVDKELILNEKVITLGNRDIFSNSTYYMGIEVKDTVERSYEITKVTIENIDDRLIYSIEGNCIGYQTTDFELDIQETANAWEIQALEETVTIENNKFIITADITDITSNTKYISHLIVKETSVDLKNNEGINENEVIIGTKTFKLSSTDVFNNGNDYYAYIEVTDSNPIIKAYKMTNATIENIGNRLIYVVEGTYSNYKASDFKIDIQEFQNTWATTPLDSTTSLNEQESTFRLETDITDILQINSTYFFHIMVETTEQINVMDIDGVTEKELTIGSNTYKLVINDLFSNQHYFPCVVKIN